MQGVSIAQGLWATAFERVLPFNAHETTIMDRKCFRHENPNDKEPLAVWMILETRQQWRATMYR